MSYATFGYVRQADQNILGELIDNIDSNPQRYIKGTHRRYKSHKVTEKVAVQWTACCGRI